MNICVVVFLKFFFSLTCKFPQLKKLYKFLIRISLQDFYFRNGPNIAHKLMLTKDKLIDNMLYCIHNASHKVSCSVRNKLKSNVKYVKLTSYTLEYVLTQTKCLYFLY